MSLEKILEKLISSNERIVIVGMGNRLKKDDAVGSILAERLSEKISSERMMIIDASISLENFIGKISKFKPSLLLIIDAADFKGAPGEIMLVTLDGIAGIGIPTTHNIPLTLLPKIIEIRRESVFIIGVQPKTTDFGEGLSEEVEKAAEFLEAVIARAVKRLKEERNDSGNINSGARR